MTRQKSEEFQLRHVSGIMLGLFMSRTVSQFAKRSLRAAGQRNEREKKWNQRYGTMLLTRRGAGQ